MSSLWTPGGEVPVDRSSSTSHPSPGPEPTAGPDPSARQPTEEEMQAHAAQLTQMLLSTPAPDVVAHHAMGLYELAVVHLSQEHPDLEAGRLAIDAFAALLERLKGRLGDAESQLQTVLPQLQMAFVQMRDQDAAAQPDAGPDSGPPSGAAPDTGA